MSSVGVIGRSEYSSLISSSFTTSPDNSAYWVACPVDGAIARLPVVLGERGTGPADEMAPHVECAVAIGQ